MQVFVALVAAFLLLGNYVVPAAAQGSSAEITFWESVRDSIDAAEIEAYLKAYPEGQFAPLARLRLKKLSAGSAADQEKAPAPGPGKTAATEPPAHECDRLAAHPSDPEKKAEGVRRAALDAAAATRACEAAVTAHPGVHRFAFQLGRALNKSGSYADAVRWFREAAEKEYPPAMNNLGIVYEEGRGVTMDEAEAVRWFRRAAEKEYPPAMNRLGRMYALGIGVPTDLAEAARWFRKAAEKGNAAAMSNLGIRYARGWGVPQDNVQAVQWLRKAAEKEYPPAMNGLGVMYGTGKGVVEDQAEAVRWYRKAAEKGNADGMTNLGLRYANGRGLPQDDVQAVQWLRKAADKGHAVAMYSVGVMYAHGRGVAQNKTEAIAWYRKAAENGDAEAKARLKELGVEYQPKAEDAPRPSEAESELGLGTLE